MNYFPNFFERITKIIDYKGFSSVNDFAKNGLKYASSEKINRLKDNSKQPSVEILLDISNMFEEVSPEWLLTGKGEMLKDSETLKDPKKLATNAENGIPLVLPTAVGGFGSGTFAIEQRDVKDYYVIPKFKHKKIDFMIEVEGSSMYPKYSSGDIVACKIINDNSFIQWNKTHVIATKDQGIIIKRLKKGGADNLLCMHSDNQAYDAFEVPKEEITGIALVVGVIRLE